METCANDTESMSALFEPEQPWSKQEDKEFESLLVKISLEEKLDPNRFELISNHFPWRKTDEFEKRYQELVADVNAIEAGQVPFPEYNDCNFWESVAVEEHQERPPETLKNGAKNVVKEKRNPESKWSEKEHKMFLRGVERLGNGDWRGISRQYVMTKTPAQVASHAQKHQLRKRSTSTTTTRRRKKRKSIHDITLDDQEGSQ